MGCAIRTTIRTITVPHGTIVAKPLAARGCWACVTRERSNVLPQPRMCVARARAGALTCQAHRRSEQAARELQNVLAAQCYGDVGEGE